MNTLEINYKHKIKSWEDFIKYVKKQFVNYEKLEGRDWNKYDFSIDCSEDQMLFKDMLQIRCIEELTEATHTLDDLDHFLEEITDSLNFFMSAYCMLDYDFKNPESIFFTPIYVNNLTYDDYSRYFYLIVDDIGYLCNLLKNRPWTQSNYLVSMMDFNERLDKLWKDYWTMLWKIGLNMNKIYELFERKYEVNKWRIKTGY